MSRLIPQLFLVVCMALAAGCKSSDASKEAVEVDSSPTYVQLAFEKFGTEAEYVENPTGEFVLVMSKAELTQMEPNPKVSFFVFGKEESEITYESEVIGAVTWLDDYYLEVVVIPGIVKADSEPGGVTYRVDARTGSRVELKAPARR